MLFRVYIFVERKKAEGKWGRQKNSKRKEAPLTKNPIKSISTEGTSTSKNEAHKLNLLRTILHIEMS